MICSALCAPDLPDGFSSCLKKTRRAGIKAIGAMKCDTSIDLTDVADVAAAVTAGTIVMLPVGIGSKPLPSSDKKMMESCLPEMPIAARTHTLNFKSFYVDNTALADFAFYNTIITNSTQYRYFWVDCNGLIYMNPDYTSGSTTIHSGLQMVINGGLVVTENGVKEDQVYEITAEFVSDYAVIAGRDVAGIETALGI